MTGPCLCGDPGCSRCFPFSWRQQRWYDKMISSPEYEPCCNEQCDEGEESSDLIYLGRKPRNHARLIKDGIHYHLGLYGHTKCFFSYIWKLKQEKVKAKYATPKPPIQARPEVKSNDNRAA